MSKKPLFHEKTQKIVISQKGRKSGKKVKKGPRWSFFVFKREFDQKNRQKSQKITLFIKKAIKHEVPKAVRSGNQKAKKGPKIALGSTDFFWRKSLHLTLDKIVPVFLPPKRSRF